MLFYSNSIECAVEPSYCQKCLGELMGEYLQVPDNHIWSPCIGWLLQRVLFVHRQAQMYHYLLCNLEIDRLLDSHNLVG